jgi:predicted DNA-binding transcriptional regulator AlpA
MPVFLRMAKVQEITSWGRTTIEAEIEAGRFPKPINVSPDLDAKRPTWAWLDTEINEWMENRIRQARAADRTTQPRARDSRGAFLKSETTNVEAE